MKKVQLGDKMSKVLEGINITADVVKSTMGAGGKLILINDGLNPIKFTKDGISVAKEIKLDDVEQNMGADLVRMAAGQTVRLVGDGTTCTSLMLQSFANSLLTYAHEDIRATLDTIDEDIKRIIGELYLKAHKITGASDVGEIATISSDSEVLGGLIKNVYEETGLDSLVSLELGDTEESHFEVKKGIEYKEGYAHKGFANLPNQQCILNNPKIFVTKKPATSLLEYKALYEACMNSGESLVVMAPRFSTEFIRDTLANAQRNGFAVCLVKLPGYTSRYLDENFKDIASYRDKDHRVEKVVVGPNYIRIFNLDTPFLNARLEELEHSMEGALDVVEKRDYTKRIHRLKGSTAVVYAGGVTEQEAKEEYDRIEDALGAVKAAIRSGYVAGGGLELYNLSLQEGIHPILKTTLQAPIRQILTNAGCSPDMILYNITDIKGYNVRNYQYEDFVGMGIIDPVEVLVECLKNSFSMAKLLARTSYNINIEYEKKLF
jgi:chaperonin GroEL